MTEISSSPGRGSPAGLPASTNPATQDGFTDISLDDDSRPLSTRTRSPVGTTDDDDEENDNTVDSFAEARQYPSNDDGGDLDAAPPPLPARPRPAAAASPYDSRDVPSESRPSTPPPPPPRPTGSAAATPHWAGAQARPRPMSIDAALASDSASSSSFAASPGSAAAAGQQRRRHTARSSYLNRPLPQTPSSPTASSSRSSWRDGQPASPTATYASFSSPLSSILSSPLAWRQSKDSTTSAAGAAAYSVPRPLRLQTRPSFSLPTPRHSRSSFYSSTKAPDPAYAVATATREGHSFELLDSDDDRYHTAGFDGDDGSGAYAYYYRQHQRQQPAAAAARDDDYNHVWLRARQSAARMARRRQWSADASKGATLRALLETAEGVFEVQACFLARLARAENDSLEPTSFPRSRAEQDQQRETMATMRQETVEALQPLLTYGPSRTSTGANNTGGAGGSKYGDGGITTLLPPAALLRGSDASSTSVAAAAEATMPSSAFSSGGSSAISNGKTAATTAGQRRRRQLPPTPPRSPNLSTAGVRRRGGTDTHAPGYSETNPPADGSWMRRASLVLFGANNSGGGGRGSA